LHCIGYKPIDKETHWCGTLGYCNAHAATSCGACGVIQDKTALTQVLLEAAGKNDICQSTANPFITQIDLSIISLHNFFTRYHVKMDLQNNFFVNQFVSEYRKLYCI
jgi:hypothetical protein